MGGSARVAAAVAAVDDAVSELVAAVADDPAGPTQEDWLELVEGSQVLANRLTSVQDVAIARAARVERVYDDDGTLVALDRGPGRVALDAADLVAPRLAVSHHQAQDRVQRAVRITGRAPEPTGAAERPRPTGLDGLHAAIRDGRLDGYRASVVADELVEAPAEVARSVIAALDPHLRSEPGPALRRRTRRLLARVSPDLLAQRAQRARRETGLRRWAAEPGVDAWYGTFPSEQSAEAWAAVDSLARRHVTDGVCATIEQARGPALTELVVQHADVRVQLVLTAPADPPEPGVTTEPAATTGPASDELVQVHGIRPSEPMFVRRGRLERLAADRGTHVVRQQCHPFTGARLDPDGTLAREGYRPGEQLTALVRARDGRCRFPGCSLAARFCDLDHVRAWPAGPTEATNLLCLRRRHHRVKQAPGWRLQLHPDGMAAWTDPTGLVTTTAPLDVLERVVLPKIPDGFPSREGPTELPSALEEALEHRLGEPEVLVRHRRCRHRAESGTDAAAERRRRLERLSGDPPF